MFCSHTISLVFGVVDFLGFMAFGLCDLDSCVRGLAILRLIGLSVRFLHLGLRFECKDRV